MVVEDRRGGGREEVSCRVCPRPLGMFKTAPCVCSKTRVCPTRGCFADIYGEVLPVLTGTFPTSTCTPRIKHQHEAHTHRHTHIPTHTTHLNTHSTQLSQVVTTHTLMSDKSSRACDHKFFKTCVSKQQHRTFVWCGNWI